MAMKIEDMTPAQQAMYLMGGGFDREQATRRSRKINQKPMNPAVDRMQDSLNSLSQSMDTMREEPDGENQNQEQLMLQNSEQATITK
jgi:hypothetical protein